MYSVHVRALPQTREWKRSPPLNSSSGRLKPALNHEPPPTGISWTDPAKRQPSAGQVLQPKRVRCEQLSHGGRVHRTGEICDATTLILPDTETIGAVAPSSQADGTCTPTPSTAKDLSTSTCSVECAQAPPATGHNFRHTLSALSVSRDPGHNRCAKRKGEKRDDEMWLRPLATQGA